MVYITPIVPYNRCNILFLELKNKILEKLILELDILHWLVNPTAVMCLFTLLVASCSHCSHMLKVISLFLLPPTQLSRCCHHSESLCHRSNSLLPPLCTSYTTAADTTHHLLHLPFFVAFFLHFSFPQIYILCCLFSRFANSFWISRWNLWT